MKKFICIILLVFCLFSFGCSKKNNYSQNVSQIRSNVYFGTDQNYSVEVFAEQRENPFINDAVASSKQNYIIVRVLNQSSPLSITAKFSGDTYTQVATYNPHATSMVAQIEVETLPSSSVSIVIEKDETQAEINCQSLLKSDTISPLNALNSVISKEKTFINSISKNGKLNAEIYIRLLAENDNNFYYVGFGQGTNKITAYLLDGKTGEIIAGKN